MIDRAGRLIKKGQTVDILLNGMFTGVVVDVREVPMVIATGRMAPPQLAIQLMVQHVPQDGERAGVYIVGEPEPQIEMPPGTVQ